jgi:hypothetical protein
LKRLLPPLLLGFGVALALIIGKRMSTDAMAVVIGVAVGVAASVPTSLLLVALLRKERQALRSETSWHADRPLPALYPPMQQPNIIVVDPSKYALQDQHAVPLPPVVSSPEPGAEAGLRRLRVIGSDDEWSAPEWTR